MAAWGRTLLAIALTVGLVGCDRTDRTFGEDGVVRIGITPAQVLPMPGTSSIALIGRRDATTSVRVSMVDVEGATTWQRDLPSTFASDPPAGAVLSLSTPRDPSHRIAVVGYDARRGAGVDLQVAMLHDSGPLVAEYGNGGIASTGVAFDGLGGARAVAGADGRLTVVARDDHGLVVVRLSPTGDVESVSHVETAIVPYDAVSVRDGILVSGSLPHIDADGVWLSSDLVVVRLTTVGALDERFGDVGMATVSPGTYNVAHELAVRGDGRIVAAGNTTANGRTRLLLAGFLADGRPDGSFGLYGMTIADAVESSFVSVALGGPGIVMVSTGAGDIVTNGFNTNGVVEESWGEDGRQVNDLGHGATATGIALVSRTCLHGACGDDARFIAAATTGDPPGGALLGMTP